MEADPKGKKIIGTFGIILGSLCFCVFFIGDYDKLIIPISDLFFVKYFLVITIINCGLFFIIVGTLNYSGHLVPYFSKEITKYQKAKINVVSIICFQPFLFSFIATLFILSDKAIWKFLSLIVFGHVYCLLILSLKTLKSKN